MLIEFEPEEYSAITTIAKAQGVSRRALVMSWIRPHVAKPSEPQEPIVQHWCFRLRGGKTVYGGGVNVGEAWIKAGYSMNDVDLIEERWEGKPPADEEPVAVKEEPKVDGDLSFFNM